MKLKNSIEDFDSKLLSNVILYSTTIFPDLSSAEDLFWPIEITKSNINDKIQPDIIYVEYQQYVGMKSKHISNQICVWRPFNWRIAYNSYYMNL